MFTRQPRHRLLFGATTALDLLTVIVDLRDRGLCEPLPLYCSTSYAYADAVRQGQDFPEEAAFEAWTSGFKWPREDRDPEHVLVLDGVRPFDDVVAAPPARGEEGPGWVMTETTRFGRLARRLWDPVFVTMAGRPG